MDGTEQCKWIRKDGTEVSFPDRRALLERIFKGDIGDDDLVRLTHDGPWVKAGEIKGSLEAAVNQAVHFHETRAARGSERSDPPAVPEDHPTEDDKEWQIEDARWKPDHAPWRRYFARMADFTLVGLVVGLLLGIVFPELFLAESSESWVWLAVMLVGFPVFDAFTLSRWHSSFGKWLLSVRTVRPNEEPISYGQAFSRAYGVIIKGMWFGFPILSLIPLGVAYSRARRGEPQPWERTARTYTLVAPFGGKVLWLVLLFLVLFMLLVLDTMEGSM